MATGDAVESYTVQGDTIYLDQYGKHWWMVTCRTEEGNVHWSLDFANEATARLEFERWRK